MKLTAKQKKKIVAAFASGEVTQTELAKRYKVSSQTISRVVKEDESFVKKSETVKKETEDEVLDELKDDIQEQAKTAKELISMGLVRAKELVKESSLRDVMGMVKVLKEYFNKTGNDGESSSESHRDITFIFADTSSAALKGEDDEPK